MPKKTNRSTMRPEAALVELYQCNGYVRVPDDTRREEEPRTYKKGYEIRLLGNTQREIAAIRRLLRQVGLKGGKPFRKHNQWVQPVYGKQALDRFNMWQDDFG